MLFLGAILLSFAQGCSTESPITLVEDAEKTLKSVSGDTTYDDFIDNCYDNCTSDQYYLIIHTMSKNREMVEKKYDQSLRKLDSGEYTFSTDEENLMRAKANFGIAFCRTWDLVDKLSGMMSAASSGGDSSIDISKFMPLIKSISETSILPIIDLYQKAIWYGTQTNFSFKFDNAWMDLSQYFGEVTGAAVLDFSGKEIDVTDLYVLSALLKGIQGAIELSISYNGLIDVLASYMSYLSQTIDKTKIFNSNPNHVNPLLDPTFGILTSDGVDSLNMVQILLTGFFSDFRDAFTSLKLESDNQSDDLLNYSGTADTNQYTDGLSWGDGLLSIVKINVPVSDKTTLGSLHQTVEQLTVILPIFTQSFTLNIASDMFEDLRASTNSLEAQPFSVTYYIYKTKLDTLLTQTGIDINDYNLPGIRLAGLFRNTISDLKSVFPLWYTTSEPCKDSNQDGQVTLNECTDVNHNGKWDQRGDIISQPEAEPCQDNNGNGLCDKDSEWSKQDDDIGILGTFVDRDSNGLVDDGYEGYLVGKGDGFYTNGDDVDTDYGKKWGEIIGHYWPDGSRSDESDGVVELDMYLFFPDPSFHGIIVPITFDTGKTSYSVSKKSMSNAQLNALLSKFSGLISSSVAVK